MKDKIVKLINSGNREDIIIGMHLLGQYSKEEISQFFTDNFRSDGNWGDRRYIYKRCLVVTNFMYGDYCVYVGLTNILPNFESTYLTRNKIVIR